ncbi:MAG: 4Fe-4S dicluster domain-containing protein [Promethearchaeota archaeon]
MIENKDLIKRIGNTGEFIWAIEQNCKGCKKCEIICPMDLWKVVNKKAILNKNYKELCLECGHCYSICEHDAIEFNFPNGGTGIIYKHG